MNLFPHGSRHEDLVKRIRPLLRDDDPAPDLNAELLAGALYRYGCVMGSLEKLRAAGAPIRDIELCDRMVRAWERTVRLGLNQAGLTKRSRDRIDKMIAEIARLDGAA